MANYNRVILLGNVTRDIELRYTSSGKAVCDIGLAVNDRRKGSDGNWIEETMFINVTFWERQAEVANEYLSKGSPVLIEGRLKLDQWEDKETGAKRSKHKIQGDRLQLLGQRNDKEQTTPQTTYNQETPQNHNQTTPDGDIPY